ALAPAAVRRGRAPPAGAGVRFPRRGRREQRRDRGDGGPMKRGRGSDRSRTGGRSAASAARVPSGRATGREPAALREAGDTGYSPKVLILLLVIYLALAIGYNLAMPVGGAPDEGAHAEYVRIVAEQWRLPVLDLST